MGLGSGPGSELGLGLGAHRALQAAVGRSKRLTLLGAARRLRSFGRLTGLGCLGLGGLRQRAASASRASSAASRASAAASAASSSASASYAASSSASGVCSAVGSSSGRLRPRRQQLGDPGGGLRAAGTHGGRRGGREVAVRCFVPTAAAEHHPGARLKGGCEGVGLCCCSGAAATAAERAQ